MKTFMQELFEALEPDDFIRQKSSTYCQGRGPMCINRFHSSTLGLGRRTIGTLSSTLKATIFVSMC